MILCSAPSDTSSSVRLLGVAIHVTCRSGNGSIALESALSVGGSFEFSGSASTSISEITIALRIARMFKRPWPAQSFVHSFSPSYGTFVGRSGTSRTQRNPPAGWKEATASCPRKAHLALTAVSKGHPPRPEIPCPSVGASIDSPNPSLLHVLDVSSQTLPTIPRTPNGDRFGFIETGVGSDQASILPTTANSSLQAHPHDHRRPTALAQPFPTRPQSAVGSSQHRTHPRV